ncbi:hypothetical protein GQ53DRAFT_111966 [Thozetella sp. PMI_491]|nr:hypothetical protein GQ53DRAFT_111966 [Thozetella sp. PMI_491]
MFVRSSGPLRMYQRAQESRPRVSPATHSPKQAPAACNWLSPRVARRIFFFLPCSALRQGLGRRQPRSGGGLQFTNGVSQLGCCLPLAGGHIMVANTKDLASLPHIWSVLLVAGDIRILFVAPDRRRVSLGRGAKRAPAIPF